jgi:drug/metabolite transporter (DMT)-like permease
MSTSATVRVNAPMRGVVCMLVSVLILTLSDTLTKWLSTGYPAGQLICLRSLAALLLVFAWSASRRRISELRIHNPGAHLVRGLFACAGSFMFVVGIGYMPLANAMSIGFAGPLMVTALAGPLLAEQVGWRRWIAVIVGFGGVLVILRPGAEGFHWAAAVLLIGVCFSTARDIVTRRISATENSSALLATTSACMVVIGLASVVQGWSMPGLRDGAMIALSGLLIGCGHYLQIEAFRQAEAAMVVPFRYTALLWATVFGWLVFGDLPTVATLIGASLVIASGLFILYRERKVGSTRTPSRRPLVKIPGYREDGA